MAVSGETIDYGPCAFMDTYDPKTVFSSIDVHGRYAYGNQPKIAEWNLKKFAETLLPFLDDNLEKAITRAQEALLGFQSLFSQYWLAGMRAKLGIFNQEAQDEALIRDLLELMEKYNTDYTNTFRLLTLSKPEAKVFYGSDFTGWEKRWIARLARQEEPESDSRRLMKENNPAIIPRNYLVEEALEAAVKVNDLSVLERLIKVLSDPFAYSPEQEEYAALPQPTGCPYKTFCGT